MRIGLQPGPELIGSFAARTIIALVVIAVAPLSVPPFAFAQELDPVIEAARKGAATYATSLPDYIVKRTTTRYIGVRPDRYFPGRRIATWRELDTVGADLAVERGTEVYTNVSLNGLPSLDMPHGGAWSMGEFSTELLSILPIERAAKFTRRRDEMLRNRPVYRYAFEIDVRHSVWNLSAGHLPGAPKVVQISPAYSGDIWIDRETGEVLRITEAARDLPGRFPLDAVEEATDYDFVKIGGEKYVLPTHSETLSCLRDRFTCWKNTTDFRDYDKFGSKSSITFEGAMK